MQPRIPVDAWRWPLAVVIGVGTMFLAVLAAGIALRILLALPHWTYPVLSYGALVSAVISAAVAARRRRRQSRAMGAKRSFAARHTF